MRREFTFNTGVRPESGAPLFGEYQRWRPAIGGGLTKVILFYADVPENAEFMFASPYDNVKESHDGKIVDDSVIVVPIEGGLCSKYGYFRIKK
jgi:hypothetical protein